MLTKLIIVLCGIFAITAKIFIRRDYNYFIDYDAFYKLHWDTDGLSWTSALEACDDEEAQLFYPKTKDEWSVTQQLFEMATEKPNDTEIFVGIHNAFGLPEFSTVDGKPTPIPLLIEETIPLAEHKCIVMNINNGALRSEKCDQEISKPFVCKRVVHTDCPTFDKGYTYIGDYKKCYKLHKREKTWNEAVKTCFMEGGALTVMDDRFDTKLFSSFPEMNRNKFYFIGIRKLGISEGYCSVKGRKILDFNGLDVYSAQENSDGNNVEECLSVTQRDGYNSEIRLFKTLCFNRNPFICEMDV